MKLIRKFIQMLIGLERPVWFFLFSILFRLALELSYIKFVADVFAYDGYLLDYHVIKYIESWIVFLCLIYVSPKILIKPSDYLINYLIFSFLTPFIVFYGLSGAERWAFYTVLMAVALIFLFKNGRPIRLPYIYGGKNIAHIILISGIVVVTSWMFVTGGLRYFNLDFNLVYEYRAESNDVLYQGVMGYLIIWATKIFGPTLLAIFLWRNNYLFAGLIFGLHILWFGISSHKSVVFYPFLIIFVWLLYRRTRALSLIPLGMSFAVISAFGLYIGYEDILTGSMIIRRTFFVPAKLTFIYYEFFSSNPFVYWSNSITSYFIDYPYEVKTPLLIGNYLGTDDSANNSFLSTGYMHAGIPGMIIYGAAVGMIFRLVDSLTVNSVPNWFAVTIIIVPFQSLLTSADLPTAMMTHGVAMSLFILYLFRSPSKTRLKNTNMLDKD